MLHIGIMYLLSMAESLKMGSKNVSNREGNLFFKLFLCCWGDENTSVEILYSWNLFKSKQPTKTHRCEKTAGWYRIFHSCSLPTFTVSVQHRWTETRQAEMSSFCLGCSGGSSSRTSDFLYRRWQAYSKAHTLCSAYPTRSPFVICSASAVVARFTWNIKLLMASRRPNFKWRTWWYLNKRGLWAIKWTDDVRKFLPVKN